MSNTLWFRYGHVTAIRVSPGQFVRKGDILAVIGGQSVNGGWSPHLHFDCYRVAQSPTAYTKGIPFEKFLDIYLDPRQVIIERGYMSPVGMPDSSVRWGFKHGQWASYPTGQMFHPGWDYNWGSGADGEVGKPVYAVTDGVVEFVSTNKNQVGTWGGLVVIKVTTEEDDMGVIEDLRAEVASLKADNAAKASQVANQDVAIKNKDDEIRNIKTANNALSTANGVLQERVAYLEAQPTGEFEKVEVYIKK